MPERHSDKATTASMWIATLLVFNIIQHGRSALAADDRPFIWRDRWRYYFPSVETKMAEILSPDCLKKVNRTKDWVFEIPTDDAVLNVASTPVKKEIVSWWKAIPRPHQMRVDPNLCDLVYTKSKPIFNGTGCQVPAIMNPFAPRCQTKYLKWICDSARKSIEDKARDNFVLPESDHKTIDLPPQPWILTARNALVSMCGQISTKCGLVHTTANCMSTGQKPLSLKFVEKCNLGSLNSVDFDRQGSTNITCMKGAPFSEEIDYHEKVFVVAEVDDTYVYHIHLEIVPRLVYHIDFLLANPDIKILVGCDSKKGKATEAGLRHMLLSMKPLLDMAGLDMSRLVVHRHVYAREIYLPMEGGCQDPVYNTWQILNMRRIFMGALQISDEKRPASPLYNTNNHPSTDNRPIMLLMKRSSGTKHTRNGHDSVRQWSDVFTDSLMNALSKRFPRYQVKLFSDKDEKLMSCHPCQIKAFAEADVLIGMHGAGLSNMLYMKPNSAVVEMCPYPNDGRCLLGGGPFSRIAAVMSHNYMVHQPPHKEYKWMTEDRSSEFDIGRFVKHIHSFLVSIDFVAKR